MYEGGEYACIMPMQDTSPSTEIEAISIQMRLRRQCAPGRLIDTGSIKIVAGTDAAYSSGRVFGAMVCVSYPAGEIVDQAAVNAPITFPYIPGLFAFRELPVLENTYPHLGTKPDLLIVEGHGYAHPRRFGLASHLGVVLGVPTIGVAKKPLIGEMQEPGLEKGSVSEILDGGEVIGMAVRTKCGARPIYVSKGCGTDLAQAVEIVACLTGNHRMPDPLIYADRLARKARSEWRFSVKGDMHTGGTVPP